VCPCWWAPADAAPGRTVRSDCKLATEHFYSVVPRHFQDAIRLRILEAPPGPRPTWLGIPCRVGHVMFAVTTEDGPPRRAFSLLALFPEDDPDEPAPFILLGTQFLVENKAQVVLDAQLPCAGELLLPWSGPGGREGGWPSPGAPLS
jgi:hypothetical protein